jgi:hypothetical protein
MARGPGSTARVHRVPRQRRQEGVATPWRCAAHRREGPPKLAGGVGGGRGGARGVLTGARAAVNNGATEVKNGYGLSSARR